MTVALEIIRSTNMFLIFIQLSVRFSFTASVFPVVKLRDFSTLDPEATTSFCLMTDTVVFVDVYSVLSSLDTP